MTNPNAYPINSRFKIATNGQQFLVTDNHTGKTISYHTTYTAALKARNLFSRNLTDSYGTTDYGGTNSDFPALKRNKETDQ